MVQIVDSRIENEATSRTLRHTHRARLATAVIRVRKQMVNVKRQTHPKGRCDSDCK
jgi:hypothetical protein